MTTLLIDTPLFKTLASGQSARLRDRLETNDASLFLSAASVFELAAAVAKITDSQASRRDALRHWLDGLAADFADRIHPLDAEVALRAGRLLSRLGSGFPRHRFHDAVLAATAQIHGHHLLTKRDAVFGACKEIAIAEP